MEQFSFPSFTKKVQIALQSKDKKAIRRIYASIPHDPVVKAKAHEILYGMLRIPMKQDATDILDMLLGYLLEKHLPMQQLSVMCVAAKDGSPKMLDHLLAKGFNVREETVAQQTPLSCAVLSGRVENIEWLLANDAAVGLSNESLVNIFIVASMTGAIASVATLIEKGVADSMSPEDTKIIVTAWEEDQNKRALSRLFADRHAVLLGMETISAATVRLPSRI